MIRKIVDVKNPKLRMACKAVGKIDKKVTDIIRDLKDTVISCKDPEGVGLAAPQIGKNVRIFVTNYKSFKKVFINPEIIKVSKTKSEGQEILEGCLSLPNYYGPLKRAHSVTVNYQNEKGEKLTGEFIGFPAQIVLHEIDHLNGVLFIDHIIKQNEKLYKLNKNDEWEEVELI